MEKAYLTMKNSGASSITLGIIVLVVGVATGILAIVNGAKLLKHKKEITFFFLFIYLSFIRVLSQFP